MSRQIQRFLHGSTKGSDNPKRLFGKVAVITGATSGIGKEVAQDLAIRGAKVLILCRNIELAKKVADDINQMVEGEQRVHAWQVDLASLNSVKECCYKITKKEPKIDYLVNNAGIMMCPYFLTEDNIELHFATNHLGHFLLTNLLLPLISEAAKKSRARIVITSSALHRVSAFFKKVTIFIIHVQRISFS